MAYGLEAYWAERVADVQSKRDVSPPRAFAEQSRVTGSSLTSPA